MDESLQLAIRGKNSSELWLRVTAFISSKSENTKRTYIPIFREWCAILGGEFGSDDSAQRVLSATDLHAAAYIEWLRGQPGMTPRLRARQSEERGVITSAKREQNDGMQATLANTTIAKKVTILRRIYRSIIAADLGINRNPFDGDLVSVPPKRSGQKRPTEMISYEKVSEILALPEEGSHKGVRDRALLSVLFGGGLRRGEVVKLRVADVRTTQRGTTYLRLRATKGKTDSDQALPDWAAECVAQLVKEREQAGAEGGDFLFTGFVGRAGKTPTNRPLSVSSVYQTFLNYCKLAGVEHFVSPHSARATAITKLLDDGQSHREVKEFSRHASIDMVELYDKRRIGIDENPGKKLKFDQS